MMHFKDVQGFDISDKSAAVIGCGGLGSNISAHLVGSGVGWLHIFDFDTVSETNLNRQFLYSLPDIGEEKVFCAKKRLEKYNGQTKVIAHNIKIKSLSDLKEVKNCDIIFLAADNNETRKTVTDFCSLHRIPLVNGGINGFFGTAYLYVPGKTPCPECAGILGENDGNIISVSSTAGIIGSLEADIGLRYILNPEEAGGVLYVFDRSEITKLKIKSNTDCKICGQKYEVKTNG